MKKTFFILLSAVVLSSCSIAEKNADIMMDAAQDKAEDLTRNTTENMEKWKKATEKTLKADKEEQRPERKIIDGWKLYKDEEYNISFQYPESETFGGKTLKWLVKKVDNKIYLYADHMGSHTEGQYVEMFEKEEKDSLEQAIEKKFLSEHSKEECFVSKGKLINSQYPESYDFVSGIDYDRKGQEPWENKYNCPVPYTNSNGVAYFIMDKDDPDRFAFFSIGQYGIPSANEGVDILWQDTFRFE